MSKEVNFGILGVGRIGSVHLETISTLNGAKILMVAEKIDSLANAVAKKYKIPQIVQDWKQVIDNPEIDAIVICTPTPTHTEIIISAAKAKKHIFCEKPLDLDLENILKVIKIVEENGVKLQVGFNRRFDSNFKRVQESVKNGEIGDPWMLHITSRDPAPPSMDYILSSGGLFMDMMIHDFDMAEFVIGSPVVEIYAMGANLVDPKIASAGDIDSAIVSLKFQNGVMGTIECCRKAVYGYDQRIEVLGSKGSIKTDNNYPNTAIISTSESIKSDLPYNFFMTRYTQAYKEELAQFLESVLQNKPVQVSAVEARSATVLAKAALKSLQEKRPVKISEIFQENSETPRKNVPKKVKNNPQNEVPKIPEDGERKTGDHGEKLCAGCSQKKPNSQFSPSQLKKKESKCFSCVSSQPVPTSKNEEKTTNGTGIGTGTGTGTGKKGAKGNDNGGRGNTGNGKNGGRGTGLKISGRGITGKNK